MNWTQTTNKVTALALAGVMALGFQGCTNEEVAIGFGVIGIAAGAIAIGAAANNRPHRPGYDRPPGYYYGHGGHYRPVRPHRPGHHRPWRISDQNFVQMDAAILQERQSFISDFAASFEIPEASAARLVNALDALRVGDAAAFAALGLGQSDFNKLAALEMPSSQGLANLAAQLGLTKAETTQIFSTLISSAKTDLQNSEGRIWRDCRATGAWRTPQASLCTSSSQAGCSVETGATLCMPVALDSATI
jgi:hypothetical protein